MKLARVGTLFFRSWKAFQFGGQWSDTFIFPISYNAGLPPGDYARALRRMSPTLARLRRGASLWVRVETPGGVWFTSEVRRALKGLPLAVAVTAVGEELSLADFSFVPGLCRVPTPQPPIIRVDWPEPPGNELRCLQSMARLEEAYTIEVAGQAGLSIPTARQALYGLLERKAVKLDTSGRFPLWQITPRLGVSLALRRWGVPPGYSFAGRGERKTATNERHRRVARLWPAWLARALPQAVIWAGWSEARIGRLSPDGLAWGRWEGLETLFWLEAESGHSSSAVIAQKLVERFNKAIVYARSFPVMLVFAVLAPPWVQRLAAEALWEMPQDAAMVAASWTSFGELPAPAWGRARSQATVGVQLGLLWGEG